MNATRRQRPSFTQAETERMLVQLGEARHSVIYYKAAQEFHGPERAAADALNKAIDGLAEIVTGDQKYFWTKPHSTGGG